MTPAASNVASPGPDAGGSAGVSAPRRRVLVLTPSPLGTIMAGPAIRASRLAEQMTRAGHVVDLLSSGAAVDTGSHRESYDVVLVQGRALLDRPDIHDWAVPVVVDLYDPFLLEALHRGAEDHIRRADLIEGARRTLSDQIARGDFFLAASEPQRDLWLGWLGAAGRINAATHAADPELRALIDVVPFGVDVRGADPDGADPGGAGIGEGGEPFSLADAHGFGPTDPIAIWAGGLHDWLDPVTVVQAFDRVRRVVPNARLVLLGAHHPDPDHETPAAVAAIHAEIDRADLHDHVFVHGAWLSTSDLAAALKEATVGVTAHRADIETRFSFRTRLLDHLGAGLPTVATAGDALSARLAEAGAAHIVVPGDPEAFASAIIAVLDDATRRSTAAAASRTLAGTLAWDHAVLALLRFVEAPHRAPDLVDPTLAPIIAANRPEFPRRLSRAVERAQVHLRAGGPRSLVSKSLRAAGRRMQSAADRSAPRP